jgi:nuclear pore complex protein Nup98-Nup96
VGWLAVSRFPWLGLTRRRYARTKSPTDNLLITYDQAIHAFSQNRVYEAFDLYVSAGLWNAAHDLAVLELAPDAVVRQDLELLQTIFTRLSGHPIDGWHLRGKVRKSNAISVNPEFISACQTFLDYANATVRLPDLKEHLDEDAVPDASEALELEELTRNVPKLIGIIPDVLRDRGDARHNVALVDMVSDLTTALDQVNSQVLVSGARKKHHQDTERFYFIYLAATVSASHRDCG